MSRHERQIVKEDPAIPNAYFESLLKLRRENATAFRLLSPALRLSVGYYEAAKREKARLDAIRAENDGLSSAA